METIWETLDRRLRKNNISSIAQLKSNWSRVDCFKEEPQAIPEPCKIHAKTSGGADQS